MTTESSQIRAKLAALSSSLDTLEDKIEPLFTQSLPETVVGLEPLQQAKLQTLLPYLINDLIFIYLKSQGVDPKSHPVITELDRIKQYFNKINIAENPPTKRTEIDKAAAARFIKHAISQSQWKKTAAEEEEDEDAEPTPSTSTPIPLKQTTKMLERAEYERELKERMETEDQEPEDELEVFNEQQPPLDKGKSKETSVHEDEVSSQTTQNSRRRRAIDPFTGNAEPESTPPASKRPKTQKPDTSNSEAPSKKRKKTKAKKT